MAVYCIGDLHGCYDEFQKLLAKVNFDDKKDELYLTGDLIGRGPKPLETMNFILRYQDCIHTVLGNHDLNFLAVTEGERLARPKDNLEPLLKASNYDEIVAYMRSRPLIKFCKEKRFAVCHAGIHPLWSLKDAKRYSKEFSAFLNTEELRPLLLRNMYRDYPALWSDDYQGMVRIRYIINVFTRMRLMRADLSLDYGHSDTSVEDAKKEDLYPWFQFTPNLSRHQKAYKLVFGHWAALNAKCPREDIVALDTGCVWGDRLTLWDVDKDTRISVKSLGHLIPNNKS